MSLQKEICLFLFIIAVNSNQQVSYHIEEMVILFLLINLFLLFHHLNLNLYHHFQIHLKEQPKKDLKVNNFLKLSMKQDI